jgi:transcriptional regulator
MYLPETLRVDDLPTLHQFMEEFNFAALVTQGEGDLIASHIPFVLDREAGEYGRLRAHIAVQNPQLVHLKNAGSDALVMFLGPHGYISPSWYASPLNVPTWNYMAVHAYGRPRMLDRGGLVALLKDLAGQHERAQPQPWDFDPQAGWIEKLLPHIAGFEIPIARLEGKFKLNQNRTAADRERVIEVLAASSDPAQRLMSELIQEAKRATKPASPSRKS